MRMLHLKTWICQSLLLKLNWIHRKHQDNAISDEEFIVELDPELERDDVIHPQIPMSNYNNDRELQEDVESGWKAAFT